MTSLTRRQMLALGGASMLPASASLAASESVVLNPSSTNLSSTADRMISYRFQERMWQTADGAYHVIINRGALSPAGSLVLNSSQDGGVTWVAAATIANTNGTSTLDGFLSGNKLVMAFSTSSGGISFATFDYNPTTKKWTRRRTDVVYTDPSQLALNPAIALDATGALWCAYVTQDRATADCGIHMAQRPAGSMVWSDTGLTFGLVDAAGIERSARPWPIPGGMGLLYTVYEKIFWATRQDGAPSGDPWNTTTIFTSLPPFDPDPYGGHFSIVTDAAGNMHMVTPDDGRALYFRYSALTQAWEAPRTVQGAVGVGYVQMAVVDGRLMMIANSVTRGEVYQSADFGVNWVNSHSLVHPAPSGTIAYSPPRLEMASSSTGPAPVLQLFTDAKLFRLMRFSVPTIP